MTQNIGPKIWPKKSHDPNHIDPNRVNKTSLMIIVVSLKSKWRQHAQKVIETNKQESLLDTVVYCKLMRVFSEKKDRFFFTLTSSPRWRWPDAPEIEAFFFTLDAIFKWGAKVSTFIYPALMVPSCYFYTGCVESTETSDLDGLDCYCTLWNLLDFRHRNARFTRFWPL